MNAERATAAVVAEDSVSVEPEMRGLRAGAIVFAGMVVANFGNYAFHLLSARYLGPAPYGDVATLAAITGIIGLPLGGLQVFVARHTARTAAAGQPLDRDGYVAGFCGACAVGGLVASLVLLAFAPLLESALSINSIWAVVWTLLFAAPSFLVPALLGAAQGRQRFVLVSIAMGLPPILRLVLLVPALLLGFGGSGAMLTTLASSVFGVIIPLVPLRRELNFPRGWRPALARRDLVAVTPVVAGLLAITALSTDDLVVAKAALPAHTAGLYGSASLIGRVILYLPAAIVTVLLPKVSSRAAAHADTGDILRRSLAATAAFCIVATGVYAAAPHLIVAVAFGGQYQHVASLLWLFGLAMTGYAILNVLLTYHLGHGSSRMSWLLLAGAAVQAVAFALFHSSPREIVVTSVACAAGLLVLHELIVAPVLVRSLRSASR